jgi:hypothetical protein
MPSFPAARWAEALPELRRPPTAEAVRFNIQNAVDEAAQVAALHRAPLVFDRLDQVCGERWYPAFDELPAALIPPPATATASLRSRLPSTPAAG